MAGNVNGHMESGTDENGKKWVAVFIDDPDYIEPKKPGKKSRKVSWVLAYYTNSHGDNVRVQLNAYSTIPKNERI